jgi:hypothetical protein
MVLVNLATKSVDRIQRAYNVKAVINKATEEGAGEWIKKHLII